MALNEFNILYGCMHGQQLFLILWNCLKMKYIYWMTTGCQVTNNHFKRWLFCGFWFGLKKKRFISSNQSVFEWYSTSSSSELYMVLRHVKRKIQADCSWLISKTAKTFTWYTYIYDASSLAMQNEMQNARMTDMLRASNFQCLFWLTQYLAAKCQRN